jgi:hypothetical protein
MSNKTITKLFLSIKSMDLVFAPSATIHDLNLACKCRYAGYVKVGLNIQFNYLMVSQQGISYASITPSMGLKKDNIP